MNRQSKTSLILRPFINYHHLSSVRIILEVPLCVDDDNWCAVCQYPGLRLYWLLKKHA